MVLGESRQVVLRHLVDIPDQTDELQVDPEGAEQRRPDRTGRTDRRAGAVLEDDLVALFTGADDAVQRKRREVQLLVVRTMRELVEAPQLFASFVVRPELLDLSDQIPHVQAEPRTRPVLTEDTVELGDGLVVQSEVDRISETRSTLDHPIPENTTVLMVLLDSLDRLLTVQRDPVSGSHVLEQRAVEHVCLLAVTSPAKMHDRSVRQRRTREYGQKQRAKRLSTNSNRLAVPGERQQVTASLELRLERSLGLERIDLRPQFLPGFVHGES